MAEALRMDILVDYKGEADMAKARNALGQFSKTAADSSKTAMSGFDQTSASSKKLAASFDDIEKGLQNKYSRPTLTATEHSNSFSASVLGAVKAGGLMAVGFAGVAGVAGIFSSAASSAAAFQTSMANVSTLLLGPGTEALAKLRAEILALPPELGRTDELAKGLYSTLSAGIEPANAVKFVGDAARAAKAGITDLSTSVDTIAGIMHAYGKEAKDATAISDVMFQTVNVGRGNFQQFSNAFAQTAPLAKTLGISLEEVGATLGTLSFAFPGAVQGGTALNSLMTNLIQHTGDFAAMGINVKQVIAEEGLTGLMKRLRDATNENDVALQKLIPDQEGYRAALAVTGPFAERQTSNLRDMGLAAGATSEAFKKQTATASEAWNALIGTMERVVQQAAPPFLSMFTGIATAAAGTITVLSKGFFGVTDLLGKGFEALRSAGEGLANKMFPELAKAELEAANARKTHGELTRERVAAEQGLAEKTKAATAASQALAEAEKRLNEVSADGNATAEQRSQAEARLAVASQAAAKATLERGKAEEEATAKTKAAAAAISEVEQFVNQQIAAQEKLKNQSKEAAEAIQNAYQGLGAKTREELKTLADGAFANFQRILETGKEPPERLRELWDNAVQNIKAFYSTLPDHMKSVDSEIKNLAPTVKGFAEQLEQSFAFFGQQSLLHVQTLADGTTVTLKDLADRSVIEFTRMLDSGTATPKQLQAAWDQMVKQTLEIYGKLPPGFAALEARMLAQAQGTALGMQAAFERVGVKTQESQQKTAEQLARDLDAMLNQTGQAMESTVKLVRDAHGKIRLSNQGTWDGVAADTKTTVTATNQDIIAVYKKMVDAINKGELKELPAEWAAIQSRMQEIARKSGMELEKPYHDAFGNIKIGAHAAFDAVPTESNAAFVAAEKGVAAWKQGVITHLDAATATAATDFGLISQSALEGMFGVDAMGNAIRDVTAEMKQLHTQNAALVRDFRDVELASIFTPWATDLKGIREQMHDFTLQLINTSHAFATSSTGIVDFGGYVTRGAEQATKALEILRLKEFELENQTWDLNTAAQHLGSTLAMAYATIGAASSQELQAAADRAVQAFNVIQQSGDESAARLRDIWINDVLPKIQEAYGETSSQALAAMQKYGDGLTTIAQNTFIAIDQMAQNTTQQVSSSFSQFGESIGNAFQQATEAAAAFGDALNALPGTFSAQPPGLPSPPGFPFGILRQHGGPVLPGQTYWVGEEGPEPFVPTVPGFIFPTPRPRASAAPQAPEPQPNQSLTIHAPISINFPVPAFNMGRIDTQEVIRQLIPAIQEALDRLQLRVHQLSPR